MQNGGRIWTDGRSWGANVELGSIDAFLGCVARSGGAVVGRRRGHRPDHPVGSRDRRGPAAFGRVFTCRSVEAEAALSFAGLSELLAPVLDGTAPALAEPRRRALEVALSLVEPGEHVPDPHVIGLAVLDMLHVLAVHGPVVVAIDDLQWMDPASTRVLHVALRRLRDERVGLLATAVAEVAGSRSISSAAFPRRGCRSCRSVR